MQISDYLLQHEEKTNEPTKGILFGNVWRHDPPSDRGTTDKPEFPQNVVDRACERNIALVSSTQFFGVFCEFLKGTLSGEEILRKIVEGIGVVNLEEAKNQS